MSRVPDVFLLHFLSFWKISIVSTMYSFKSTAAFTFLAVGDESQKTSILFGRPPHYIFQHSSAYMNMTLSYDEECLKNTARKW